MKMQATSNPHVGVNGYRYAITPDEKSGNLWKRVRQFPTHTKDGETRWSKLKFPLYRAVLKNLDTQYELILRCSLAAGTEHPRFSIQHPDRWEHPKLKVGRGRVIADVLLPKEKVAGEKEQYDEIITFERRMVGIAGPDLFEELWTALCQAITATDILD